MRRPHLTYHPAKDRSADWCVYVFVDHLLDTRALAPGPHLLTVNVLAYDDHFGTQTIRFERGAK